MCPAKLQLKLGWSGGESDRQTPRQRKISMNQYYLTVTGAASNQTLPVPIRQDQDLHSPCCLVSSYPVKLGAPVATFQQRLIQLGYVFASQQR